MSRVSRAIDRVEVTFDDETLVADAGLIVPATLMVRLGLEALVNQTVRLVGRVGGARPGRKVLTLVASILAGGQHIDHADRLRAGATQAVLPFRVMAPSTLGTFLRGLHLRARPPARRGDRRDDPPGLVAGRRARRGGGDDRSGLDDLRGPRQGQARRRLRLHEGVRLPPAAGHPGRHRRGAPRPAAQGILPAGRQALRRRTRSPGSAAAGATGAVDRARRRRVLELRADRHAHPARGAAGRSRCASTPASARRSTAIDEDAWTTIAYPDGGQAQVAETTYVTGAAAKRRRELRLVVRRTRLTDPAQRQLWPDWRHHAFITNVELPTVAVDQFHRDHATVELAIRDLKEGAGLEHCPSGRFFANAAWLGCAVLAHNLDPLDRPPRRRPPRRPAHRHPHRPHPAARPARPARQPQPPLDPAAPRPMAMGQHVQHRARPHPLAAAAHLSHDRGPARPHTTTTR